jgi:hypothetical protein
MSQSRFYLCAVPKSVWEQPAIQHQLGANIQHFVADALGCERRMAKEVNLENEHSRYRLCCQRLEQEIIQSRRVTSLRPTAQWTTEFISHIQQQQFPAVELPTGYLALLAHMDPEQPSPARLGASFFVPSEVGTHRAAFIQWAMQNKLDKWLCVQARFSFFEIAERLNCGVIELQSGFHPALPTSNTPQPTLKAETESIMIEVPTFVRDGITIESFGPNSRKQKLANTLTSQINDALQTGDPVGFGNQAPHDVITEVLNKLVYVPAGQVAQPAKIRVVYADGTEAEPFPLFCLPRYTTSALAKISPLRVALMSMRHPELDPDIDFCWFRNREVSRTRTLAETDDFCYQTSLEQLRDCLKQGPLRLSLYHTGFEPAVLGFYRAVVTLLRDHTFKQKHIHVTPYYFRGNANYQPGTEWF